MLLRALVLEQVAFIALIGVAARAPMSSPLMVEISGSVAALGFLPALIGFPLAVAYQLRGANFPWWRRWVVLGVEAALVACTLLAIFPMVQ